jgi:Zn-finger nucleic acid-binding protein
MIRCAHCSAPLPAYAGTCAYCGGVNDIDRETLARTSASGRTERYPCPVCAEPMAPVEIGLANGALPIDRCGKCLGLFFPFYGLEPLLADTARFGELVDVARLGELARQAPIEAAVAYRKCPRCGKLMNRVNFGARSGVITDQCRGHGIWLDAGELKRLVEWKNSGGSVLEAERRRQLEREAERKRLGDEKKIARWRAQAGGGEG